MALSGTELVFVTPVQGNGQLGAIPEQTTTQAIANLGSGGGAGEQVINTAITTVGAGVLTGAAIAGGVITRTGSTAAYTDTTDTAALIVAAVSNAFVGQSFYLRIKNGTNFAETLVGGSGVTFSGTSVIIPPNSVGTYLVTLTSLTAISILHIVTALLSNGTPKAITTLSTVGAATITGAGIASGITNRTGSQSGTPFNDTTDTASNIIAADLNSHIGDSWEWVYVNTTNAASTISNGTGVTVSGITVVPAGYVVRYLVTYTAAATVTIAAISVNQAATSTQSLVLAGSTSGTTTVNSGAAAGSSVLTLPVATDTLVGKATTDTLTNKTLTAPVISSISNTGTITLPTATDTLVGRATTDTLTNKTITGAINTDTVRSSAAVTANANVTYADVTGLVTTVVPGTYKFRVVLPSTVASGTGGIKYAFHYVTTVLTSIESTAMGFTAAAVAVQHTTTTTDVADLFSQAAVVILTVIEGTTVVGTGGTIQVQMAQNTSNASNSVALISASLTFNRIA